MTLFFYLFGVSEVPEASFPREFQPLHIISEIPVGISRQLSRHHCRHHDKLQSLHPSTNRTSAHHFYDTTIPLPHALQTRDLHPITVPTPTSSLTIVSSPKVVISNCERLPALSSHPFIPGSRNHRQTNDLLVQTSIRQSWM